MAQLNTNGATYGLTRAIVETAEEEKAPVILGAYAANADYRGLPYCGQHMRFMGDTADVPIAVHLDHGKSVDVCLEALEAGFTSVMYDGSRLPIEDNIRQTERVARKAATSGASMEAEVGQLMDDPDADGANLSDPSEVRRLCAETDIDFLAVGIGTAHGFYDVEPEVDLDLLAELNEAAPVPLVLHGTTGLEDRVVRECISRGISKVNVGTLLRTRYVEYTSDEIEANNHEGHPWRVSRGAMRKLKDDVRYLLNLTDSSGRA